MKISNLAAAFSVAVLACGTASMALAEGPAKHKGLYVSGGLGLNWLEDSDISGDADGTVDFNTGWMAGAAVGYGFGNGLRFEGELSYRRNTVDRTSDDEGNTSSGEARAGALMGNLIYDFDVHPSVVPYIGLGAGVAVVEFEDINLLAGGTVDDDDTVFAWQGLAGVAVPLQDQLDLTFDYRYFHTADPEFGLDGGGDVEGEYVSHSLMVGLRYRFPAAVRPAPRPEPATTTAPALPPKKPEPAPMAKPKPAPAPPPEPRSFLVFFDWDRANIRPDAQRVLEAAVQHAKELGLARVHLTGHADRSGPARYNMGLSLKRAENVKAALVKLGMNEGNIDLVAKGETMPLVATEDGVREPRNRRVEIVF